MARSYPSKSWVIIRPFQLYSVRSESDKIPEVFQTSPSLFFCCMPLRASCVLRLCDNDTFKQFDTDDYLFSETLVNVYISGNTI